MARLLTVLNDAAPPSPPPPPVHADARVTLAIGGMTCASCTAHVAGALKSTDGVADASADLLTRSAAVSYDSARTTPAALVDAVRKSGYDADLPRARDQLERQRDDDRALAAEARSLLIRALILIAGMLALMAAMFLAPPSAMVGTGAGATMREHATNASDLIGAHAAGRGVRGFDLATGWPDLLALVVTVVLAALCARPIFARAIAAARRGKAQMDTLVALGASAALLSSAAALFGFGGEMYLEGVLGILGFVQLGNALEARVKRSTTRAIVALASLEPKRARIERDEDVVDVDTDELRRGDVLVIRPGERVPADATIESGESELDESMLTGEPLPRRRTRGDKLVGGSVNGSGVLRARIVALGEDSVLAQMVRLMREAQGRRAPIEKLADRVSAVFVPAVIAIAVAVLVVWLLVDGDVAHAVRTAVAVLVVACPCAMGLAVPTAVMVASGRAAHLGVVVKGGDVFERASRVNLVVFDKTGTLTLGKPRVVDVVALEGTADRAVAIAAALERGSEHPLARAVEAAAKERGLVAPVARDVVVEPGRGVRGIVDGVAAFVGAVPGWNLRADAFAEVAAPLEGPTRKIEAGTAIARVEAAGASAVVVVVDARVAAVLGVADELRPSAKDAVAALAARGIKSALLTGDRAAAAQRVAAALGIDVVRAEVSPAGKVEAVRAWKKAGVVAMVGDGINDAAALAEADVGIALAGGTDVAVEAADISLVRPDLMSVPKVLALSRATMSTMRRNLFWAAAYNAVAIPVAAGAFGIHMNPVVAAACMSLSSVSVVVSSLLLRVPR